MSEFMFSFVMSLSVSLVSPPFLAMVEWIVYLTVTFISDISMFGCSCPNKQNFAFFNNVVLMILSSYFSICAIVLMDFDKYMDLRWRKKHIYQPHRRCFTPEGIILTWAIYVLLCILLSYVSYVVTDMISQMIFMIIFSHPHSED